MRGKNEYDENEGSADEMRGGEETEEEEDKEQGFL